MKPSPSWQATNRSATQYSDILWNWKVHYRAHKSHTLAPYPEPDESSPYHTIPSYFSEMCFMRFSEYKATVSLNSIIVSWPLYKIRSRERSGVAVTCSVGLPTGTPAFPRYLRENTWTVPRLGDYRLLPNPSPIKSFIGHRHYTVYILRAS
jgi:hypothetical protein